MPVEDFKNYMKGNGSFQLLPKGAGGNVQLSEAWLDSVSKKIEDPVIQKQLIEGIRKKTIKTGVIGVDKKTGDLILVPVNVK